MVGWTLIRRFPLDVVANAMAPATAMGYAIGRIGCQLAGDGDYGKVSTLPWAMGYPHGTVPTPPGVRVQPTPIYEIIAMSFVVWILWRLATRYDKSGWWTFGWFLVLSGVERILVEFVRRNPIWFWHLTQPQWVSIVSVVIGVVLIAVYGKKAAVLIGDAAKPSRAGDQTGGASHVAARRSPPAAGAGQALPPATSLGTRRSGQGAVFRSSLITAP